jgi:sucrose-6-phosphate hydrolase SacC (GH32 family)
LRPGADDEWDAVSVRFPHALFHDGLFHLFYGTFQDFTTPVAIGYATSEDGIHWMKFEENPIFEADGTGFDAFGVTTPVITIMEDGTWVMVYNGIPAQNSVFGTGIGRAIAPSPTGPWTREDEPVLEVGASGEWDARFIFPSSLVQTEDGYALYYSAGFMLGRADSEDGITWTKYDAADTPQPFAESDPVLRPGESGSWDSAVAWAGSVQHSENGWEMFYTGAPNLEGGPNINVGYAYSDDGFAWTKYADNPVIDLERDQAFFPAFLIMPDSTYFVYYAVTPGAAFTEFHLSTGTVQWEE